MTVFLLSLVVGGSVFGDLLKARGMRLLGEPESFRPSVAAHFATRVIRNRWFLVSLAAYTVSFFGFMALLSIEDVSFAVPATATGYVLETLLARWVLRETVSAKRWIGAALVVAGVWLIV